MRPFLYERAADPAAAVGATRSGRQPPTAAPAQFIAGGTTLLDLMKLDAARPERLVDINGLPDAGIEAGPAGLRLGALVRMAEAERHPALLRDYPVIAQALQQAASPQLRAMATLGGNVLQRTRCSYFRDRAWSECNKRSPGSGCAALGGLARRHAVLGVSDQCIASYPGDLAQALVALGATVQTLHPEGPRSLPFESLHAGPEEPVRETVLLPGELITAFTVPAGPWTRRSLYLKVRDRESYAFALTSAAVALDIRGGVVREARIGLGGVAYRPWRAHPAEAALRGKPLDEAAAATAAEAAFADARTRPDNAFKPDLGRRTLVRALLAAARMEA